MNCWTCTRRRHFRDARESGIHVILDRLVLRPDNRHRLVRTPSKSTFRKPRCIQVEVIGQGLRTYSARFSLPGLRANLKPLRPLLFSFNHPLGGLPRMQRIRQYPAIRPRAGHPGSQQVARRRRHRALEQAGFRLVAKADVAGDEKLGVDTDGHFQEFPSRNIVMGKATIRSKASGSTSSVRN